MQARMIPHAFFTITHTRLLYSSMPQFRLSRTRLDEVRQRIRQLQACAKKEFGGVTPATYPEFRKYNITLALSPEEVDDIVALLEAMHTEAVPNPPHIRVMLEVRDIKDILDLIALLRAG
jgi:hypothetical protein